jgi:hypothetical protein
MRQRISAALLREARAAVAAPAEDVGEFGERRQQIHHAKTRDCAADKVVGQQCANGGDRFDKIVAIPEGGPWDEDEQQACFQEQGDEKQTSEQSGLPFGPGFRKTVNPARNITVAAGFGFELGKHGQGARAFADFLERIRQIV